ncbi:MAG: topoisomerase [Rhodocyclales bacterium]|nr:topoisomerase [Rhodocyclales bacterium]
MQPHAARKRRGRKNATPFYPLNYVRDDCQGISRRQVRGPKGIKFIYFLPDGSRLRDADEIRRINALAIPPAYADVWICTDPDGHLQATGRDARGRKQYRYHARWREMRDANKYDRMLAFSQALPLIRQRVDEDLALPGMPRQRVLATLVRLLETTLIRVGNEAYVQANDSYGLTTLQNEHVEVQGSRLSFRFRGKSGVEHDITVRDARVARIVKRCADIPGHELFQYLDENGERHKVGSGDVNEYLRTVCGQGEASPSNDSGFTAKDFRTWAGSVLALELLMQLPAAEAGQEGAREGVKDEEAVRKKNIVSIVEIVASRLGNTPAVCRRCYIHPAILQAYQAGSLTSRDALDASAGLDMAETRLQHFLQALPVTTAA